MSGRSLAHIIGLLSSVTPAVLQAPLHYRGLQRLRSKVLQKSSSKNPDYDVTVPLSQEAQDDLIWWIEYSFQEGRPLRWPHHRIRCVKKRLGSAPHSSPADSRWDLEQGGSQTPYQLVGTKHSLHGSKILCTKPLWSSHPSLDGPHCRNSLPESSGGNQIVSSMSTSNWHWCLQRRITIHADHLRAK